MTVTFGTVASVKAKSSLAPFLMMPPCSCAMPGRNPGTSSNVTIGMLKQSQKRTKRAPLIEASMSRTPARTAGWFAAMPTERPPRGGEPGEQRRVVPHDAHGTAAQAGEARCQVPAVAGVRLEEVPVVHPRLDHLV